MFAANHLRKNNPVILRGQSVTSSLALKYAWWFESFRAQLASGVYRFSYLKKDGTVREARGTLDFARIPEDQLPKGSESSLVNGSVVNYFDIEKAAWRSFRLDNFVGFVERIR